jgi:8-oxo-dGTP pyrophosphatase MutT (NUDIX family)
MKRSEREGDRWSGHVSFPGGRYDDGDVDLMATAVRETREELSLDLERAARPIGRLDDVAAVAAGKVLPMAISPFVFVQTERAELTLNEEAESAFWLPLARVASGELSGTVDYTLGPVPLKLACWRFEDYVIWGLTHKMLSRLLALLH